MLPEQRFHPGSHAGSSRRLYAATAVQRRVELTDTTQNDCILYNWILWNKRTPWKIRQHCEIVASEERSLTGLIRDRCFGVLDQERAERHLADST